MTLAPPFVRWLPQWRQKDVLRADLLPGLTGAIAVLPQGVALATLAGMPPAYGLYAAMVPCMVAALFGSSRLMVTGPANAISLTTMAPLAPLAAVAAVGSSQYVAWCSRSRSCWGRCSCCSGSRASASGSTRCRMR